MKPSKESFIKAGVEALGWDPAYAEQVWAAFELPPDQFLKAIQEACDDIIRRSETPKGEP